MASADRRDLPVYTLADLPWRVRHVVLTPAIRWRVVVEQVKEIEHDIILETVLRLRAAGESSPGRIADLLQLPDDLIRHLLAQAVTERLRVTADGQLQASGSEVAWVYRDLATGELWPDPAPEVPPLPVRFTSAFRGRFARGTAGRPVSVACLLLDTDEHDAAEPTAIELARFGRGSADRGRRTAIVSSGEPCLVASPVLGVTAGYAIETTRGVPHSSLTRHLVKTSHEHQAVSNWLREVPRTDAPPSTDLPLKQAIAELRDIVDVLRNPRPAADEFDSVLGRVELCLSRFVDQYRYLHDLDTSADPSPTDAFVLGTGFGLDRDAAALLAGAKRGTLGHKVARLLLTEVGGPAPHEMLRSLAVSSAEWLAVAHADNPQISLTQLVNATIALCDQLITVSENIDGRQASQRTRGCPERGQAG